MTLKMRKREITNNAPYRVKIDFDRSSKAWRKNKIKLSKGGFRYISDHPHKMKLRSRRRKKKDSY